MEVRSSSLGVWRLTHWTTREVPTPFILAPALVTGLCTRLTKSVVSCEGDKASFLFQLYEIFTCLGELGAIAQVHAENGDIIAQVTRRGSSGKHLPPIYFLISSVLPELSSSKPS